MSQDEQLRGSGEKFKDVAEAKIEAGEDLFGDPHPFLRTAVRGLAGRLNGEVVPMGLVMATELYIADMQTGVDGFTGEPMPSEVTGMPPVTGAVVRIAASYIAQEAFGSEFADAVDQVYASILADQEA